ncbi:MAG: hypothetical protein ACRELG_02295 [Gemmataceae bacterium]
MPEGWVVLARCVGVAVLFPLVAFAFGWAVLELLTDLRREQRFAASWGGSFALLAGSEFLAFLTGADQTKFNLATLVLMLAVVVLCRFRARPRNETTGDEFWPVVSLCALGYAELICLQMLLPNYMGSHWYFDWWMHYDEALVFRGVHGLDTTWAEAYNLASRTPLYNLTGAFVLSLAGDEFSTFQLASSLMGVCFLPALYLVLRDLCGPRAGRLGLLLAPLNLWMLHNAWFTWPKMLTAYFLLLGLHFYLQSVRMRPTDPGRATRCFRYFAVSSLLGFMTHQAAAVYAAVLLLHAALLAWRRSVYRLSWKEFTALAALALAIAGPWYAWLAWTFGPAKVGSSTPVTLGDPSASFTPWNVLTWTAVNTYSSVVPRELLDALSDEPTTFAGIYHGLTALYFSLYTGALTLSLTAFLLVTGCWGLTRCARDLFARLRERMRRGTAGPTENDSLRLTQPSGGSRDRADWPAWSAAWFFALLGAVGATALHPGQIRHGVAHAACFPTALLLAALAWGRLSRAPRRWASVVCAGMVAEFLLMLWSHCWMAVWDATILDPSLANDAYKRDAGLVFLNDRLGLWVFLFVAATAIIQLVLCMLLFRWLRVGASAAPTEDKERAITPKGRRSACRHR